VVVTTTTTQGDKMGEKLNINRSDGFKLIKEVVRDVEERDLKDLKEISQDLTMRVLAHLAALEFFLTQSDGDQTAKVIRSVAHQFRAIMSRLDFVEPKQGQDEQ
jgi:hypothetical protein